MDSSEGSKKRPAHSVPLDQTKESRKIFLVEEPMLGMCTIIVGNLNHRYRNAQMAGRAWAHNYSGVENGSRDMVHVVDGYKFKHIDSCNNFVVHLRCLPHIQSTEKLNRQATVPPAKPQIHGHCSHYDEESANPLNPIVLSIAKQHSPSQ